MDKRGKITLSVIIISIVLVSFVSVCFVVALDINTKVYDEKTKTVTIKNGKTEIAKVKLNTPLVYNVIRGKDRLVAEFTIESSEDYTDAFNGMAFYDAHNGMKKFDRNFSYKYKSYKDVTIPDYELVCKERIVSNGTEKYDCVQNQIGSHIEQKIKWNNLDSKAELPKGTITIGVFADVYQGDYIEWVPTLFGVEIDEWAVWTESLSVGLTEYFKLNATSGAVIESVFENDFVNLDSLRGQSGVINNSFYFDTDTDRFYGNLTDCGTTWSLALWIKRESFGAGNINIYQQANPRVELFFRENRLQVLDGAWRDSGYLANFTNWNLVVLTQNSSGYSFFVNGTYIATVAGYGYVLGNQVADFGGSDLQPSQSMGGYLDEIGIWNRTLSHSEISDLWNNGNGITYEPSVIDTTPPNVTINTPTNTTYTLTTITFNVTALDETAMDSCWYSLNSGATNHTMDNSSISPDDWTATNTTMAQGFHTVNFYCDDSLGNLNNTESRTFAIDTTAPNVIIDSPSPTNYTTNSIDFNVTATDETAVSSCWYTLNNGIDNIKMENNTASNFYHTNSSIGKGSYTAKFFCNDTANNINDSEQVIFTILNSAPNQTNPLLQTPTLKNLSTEDLICYNQSTSDADNDEVTNIYNWYKNNQTFLALNLAFENNVNDYSGNDNDGTKYGAIFTDGKIGKALEFDGIDDYVKATKNFGISFNSFSAEAWVNLKDIGTQHRYILERDDIHFYISVTPEKKIRFRHIDLTNGETETESNAIEFNEWAHITVVYDGTKTYIYINGELKKEQEDTGNISFSAVEPLYIGSSKYATSYPDRTWNGTIDEVKIYSHALTQQQAYQNYLNSKDGLTSSSIIVSQQTSGGDEWMCQVTPNDGEEDGLTKNSSELEVLWAIEFNVTDSYFGTSLNNVVISCNYTEFSQEGDTTNLYGPYGFPDENWECKFEVDVHYDKLIIFNANEDKIIDIKLSEKQSLTTEEHTWLEAIYNCLYQGDCKALNLLEQINETTTNVWNQLQTTDTDVVLNEDVTSYEVSETSNLSIDYEVYVPIKSGYSIGDFLPIRIAYWFLDENNKTCYDQGDKPTGVESPYCYPLVIETLGPMGGEVNFTVDLRPELPEGTYTIIRDIEIDPAGIWTKYGQEIIGEVEILDDVGKSWIGLTKNKDSNSNGNTNSNDNPDLDEEKTIKNQEIGAGITGAIIGATSQVSGWQLISITGILAGIFIVLIICQTILKIKRES